MALYSQRKTIRETRTKGNLITIRKKETFVFIKLGDIVCVGRFVCPVLSVQSGCCVTLYIVCFPIVCMFVVGSTMRSYTTKCN